MVSGTTASPLIADLSAYFSASVTFDMPTVRGLDSDRPMALGEVDQVGQPSYTLGICVVYGYMMGFHMQRPNRHAKLMEIAGGRSEIHPSLIGARLVVARLVLIEEQPCVS